MAASDACYLANNAAIALRNCGELKKALGACGATLRVELEPEDWREANTRARNISRNLSDQNLLAIALRMDALALEVAAVSEDDED